MNSGISKAERQALEELFLTLGERKSFIDKLRSSRTNMKKFLKQVFKLTKKHNLHS